MASDWNMVSNQQSFIDQSIDQWRDCFIACLKAKANTLNILLWCVSLWYVTVMTFKAYTTAVMNKLTYVSFHKVWWKHPSGEVVNFVANLPKYICAKIMKILWGLTKLGYCKNNKGAIFSSVWIGPHIVDRWGHTYLFYRLRTYFRRSFHLRLGLPAQRSAEIFSVTADLKVADPEFQIRGREFDQFLFPCPSPKIQLGSLGERCTSLIRPRTAYCPATHRFASISDRFAHCLVHFCSRH